MSVISLPTCGPVRTKQNFVCFAKNSVNSEAFLVQTNFSSPSKVFSIVTKVHRCHREELETYNFLSGDNLLCSLTAILRRVILFRTHDQLKLLQLAFLVKRKISRRKIVWGGWRNMSTICRQNHRNAVRNEREGHRKSDEQSSRTWRENTACWKSASLKFFSINR